MYKNSSLPYYIPLPSGEIVLGKLSLPRYHKSYLLAHVLFRGRDARPSLWSQDTKLDDATLQNPRNTPFPINDTTSIQDGPTGEL